MRALGHTGCPDCRGPVQPHPPPPAPLVRRGPRRQQRRQPADQPRRAAAQRQRGGRGPHRHHRLRLHVWLQVCARLASPACPRPVLPVWGVSGVQPWQVAMRRAGATASPAPTSHQPVPDTSTATAATTPHSSASFGHTFGAHDAPVGRPSTASASMNDPYAWAQRLREHSDEDVLAELSSLGYLDGMRRNGNGEQAARLGGAAKAAAGPAWPAAQSDKRPLPWPGPSGACGPPHSCHDGMLRGSTGGRAGCGCAQAGMLPPWPGCLADYALPPTARAVLPDCPPACRPLQLCQRHRRAQLQEGQAPQLSRPRYSAPPALRAISARREPGCRPAGSYAASLHALPGAGAASAGVGGPAGDSPAPCHLILTRR